MGQTWDDLLFLHYRVPAVQLRPLVPNRLELQEHSGSAWLGVTPFVITGLRARGLLPLPFASSFRELMEATPWENYGRKSGNEKCRDCMVHCGYEATAVDHTFSSLKAFAETAVVTLTGKL